MVKSEDLIWITGASSGIGKEAAKAFARISDNVYISSRKKTNLELVNKELRDENHFVKVIPCDIASPTDVDMAVKRIYENGNVDCLINNAGVTSFTSAEDNSIDDIKNIIEINLLGSIYCIKSVLPGMIKKKRGTIINIISVAAKKIFTESSAYSASKAGLLAYTNVLREEIRKYNIRVINILPGATNTPIWPEEILKKSVERMMNPKNIADFLVSVYLLQKNIITEEIVIRPIDGDI